MSLRIGIDVGGTNTDAVLMDASDRVLGRAKVPTSPDVVSGIRAALARVLTPPPREPVTAAMLGTTQCTNAVVQRRGLRRVAIVRLGAPATAAVPPLADWPPDLRSVVGGPVTLVAGGHDYMGHELAPLDEAGVRRAAVEAAERDLPLAIVGVFSAVNPEHERRAAEICAEVAGPEHPVSISSEIGSVGLLERENATVLNAALTDVAEVATRSFEEAVKAACGAEACYFTQNDGTLMALAYARRYPSLMLASGPANSMRGAAFLSGVAEALVVDVGGTTTDVGVLVDGFPREAPFVVEVAGVRTNFRMPDVVSLPLGGGTVVRWDGGRVALGPDSVGYRLLSEGLAFGGTRTTFTDVVLALGRAELDVPVRRPRIPLEVAEAAYRLATELLDRGVDRMRPSSEPLPVIGVGGGSVLLPPCLGGNLEVVKPADFAVANAIGAAISEVSGGVDRIVALGSRSIEDLREEVRREAFAQAVAAGADAGAVRIVLWEEIPVAYLPGNAMRLRAKAAGPLARGR
ncbi:MAG TPA: hydantoinase/oxoprolinase family protein [Acidimicrobiales bacterium]|nr:hydantoinase/oxoprolinase family protein [Acidimicrobiales bacterium]